LLADSYQKQEEEMVSCTDTSAKLDFEFSVQNNLDIDGITGPFSQLLNLV